MDVISSFHHSLCVCVCANALPPRKHIRKTDVHKKTSLSLRFLFWFSLFLGGLGFRCLSTPHPHLFTFLFKNGKVFLFLSQKDVYIKGTASGSFLPSLPGKLKWIEAHVWITGSTVLARGKTFSVAPPRRGQGSDNKQFNFWKPRGAFSCGALSCFSGQGSHLQQTAVSGLFLGLTCQCRKILNVYIYK